MLKLTNHWFQTTKYGDMLFGEFVLESCLKLTHIVIMKKLSCYCKMDAQIKESFMVWKEKEIKFVS